MSSIRSINQELAKVAREELNEVPERISDDLEALKEWIRKQPHLRARTDDQFLVGFLRGCKWSLERSKEKIEDFYTLRSRMPELMKERNPLDKRTQELIRNGVALPLPVTENPGSPRIMLIRPAAYNPEKFTFAEVMKVGNMISDILLLEDDNLMIAGQIDILDLANVTAGHFLQMNPGLVKKVTILTQKANPMRQLETHCLNTPPGFETLFNMFKGFVGEKQRNRIHIHGNNIQSLFKHIPQRLFPEEYGGEVGKIGDIIDVWERKLAQYADCVKIMSEKIRQLTPELAKLAQEELNEVPERISEDIAALKEWIRKQPHLRARTDDQFLVGFLRGCKWSLERAKEKIDSFYTARTVVHELMSPRDPLLEKNLTILRLGYLVPLPHTEFPHSPRVVLIRYGCYDPDKYSIVDVLRLSVMIGDLMHLEDDNRMCAGEMALVDMENTTMKHFFQVTPMLMKKLAMMTQEAAPIRQKGFHFFNTAAGFEVAFGAFRNLMKEKLRQRMPNIRPISSDLAKVAKEELNEVPERISDDLEALREWIRKQPHLRARTDDQFLVTFFRGCKWSLERTKQKLDTFYTVRTALPDLISHRDPLEKRTLDVIRMGFVVPLPLTERPDSPRIMLFRPGVYNPTLYSIHDMMRVSLMVNDILLCRDDNRTIAGQIGIVDLAGATMAHLGQANVVLMKKFSMITQDASPLRQKGFHFVNAPSGFATVYNLAKGMFNEKMQQRFRVHTDRESLFKIIPKRLLPSEYGGEAGPIQKIIDDLEKDLIAARDFFREEDNFGTNEKKRIGRPKNAETLFGVEGSFRKLAVD
uniref:CRAL-TRIO domain-containing protein n=1 Tax=Phlebotomus papatasi TaxID=29031 RepID=A0A1B0DFH3_PHLPP